MQKLKSYKKGRAMEAEEATSWKIEQAKRPADERRKITGHRQERDAPATAILRAPTLPFVVKLTTLRPNAMIPFPNRMGSDQLRGLAMPARTCESSPVR